MLTRALLAAALVAAIASPAAAQSFDCAKAQTRTEKLICADRAVADLTEYLGRYYSAARAAVPGAEACVQADQQQWLKTKRDACQDGACLHTGISRAPRGTGPAAAGRHGAQERHASRGAGARLGHSSRRRYRRGAPPNPKAQPYKAIGTLVDDIATNANSDGIALRTKDGTRIPLQLTMFLDGPTQAAVASLSKQASALYRARGYAATDNSRHALFRTKPLHLPAIACRPPVGNLRMPRRYWLMKCEPAAYTIDDLERDERHELGRRAQLPGAQFHARPDAGRRRACCSMRRTPIRQA